MFVSAPTRRLLPYLLVALVGTVYLVTIHCLFTWDGLFDAVLLKEGRLQWPWSAAHPLADYVQLLAVRLLGAAESPLPVMAAVNALACAGAVGLTYGGLEAATKRPGVAAGAALLLAFSGAFWFYAGNAESYGPGLLGAALILWSAGRYADRPSPAAAALAGAGLGVGVLLHVVNGGLAAAFVAAWAARSRRAPEALAFLAAALACSLPVLYFFMAGLSLPFRPDGWQAWMRISLGAGRPDFWVPEPGEVLRRLPYLLAGRPDPSEEILARGNGYPVLAWGTFLLAVGYWGQRTLRPGDPPALRWPLLASLGALGAMFALADGRNEFLVVLLVPALWLLGLEAARTATGKTAPGLLLAAALLAAVNLTTLVLPGLQSSGNPHLARAEAMARRLAPSDHLFVRNQMPGLAVRSVAPCPVYMLEVDSMPPDEVQAMRAFARDLVDSGRPAYMDGDLLDWIRSRDVAAPRIRELFKGLRAVPVEGEGAGLLYRLEPDS